MVEQPTTGNAAPGIQNIGRYDEHFPLSLIDETDEQFQARLGYDEANLAALEQDIAQHGQRNPIGIVQKGDRFQVVYGFHRVKIMKRLRKETIRANIYVGLSEKELYFHSISDNERLAAVTDLEKALRINFLQDKGFTVDELCEAFGLKKSAVYNYLKVVDIDDTTRDCLQLKLITLNHAVELARVEDLSKRLETLKMVISHEWSLRDLKLWLREGHSPTMMIAVNGSVDLCPRTMRYTPLYDCKKCQYFGGFQMGEELPGGQYWLNEGKRETHERTMECKYTGGPYSEIHRKLTLFEEAREKAFAKSEAEYFAARDQRQRELVTLHGTDQKYCVECGVPIEVNQVCPECKELAKYQDDPAMQIGMPEGWYPEPEIREGIIASWKSSGQSSPIRLGDE